MNSKFKDEVTERFWANVEERFWNHVTMTDDAESCWPWNGATVDGKYGKVIIEGKAYRAHVVSFELNNGPVPLGLYVLHTCDNGLCVRPSHLEADTQSKNITDAYARGRIVQVKSVSPEVAAQIIAMYATGNYSQDSLAEHFKTSQRAVSAIVRGVY